MSANEGIVDNLTKSQMLLWAGQELSPGVPLYNMAFGFWIDGEVDPDAFARSFRRLVRECDVLRTVIDTSGGVPRRVVLDKAAESPEYVDLSAQQDPEIAAQQWMQSRCEDALDLTKCWFTTAIIRVRDRRWIWFLNQHHLGTDGWSVPILFRTLARFYGEELSFASTDESPQPLGSYEIYAKYERAARESAERTDHWERASEDSAAAPRLYGYRDDVGTESERVTFPLDEARLEKLRRLALEPGVRALTQDMSFFQILATTTFAWLSRVSNQQDLSIAAPAHNRVRPEFRNLVGLLTEVFPLRVEVQPDDTFRSLLERVRVETTSYLRHAVPGSVDANVTRSCNVVLNYIRGSFPDFAGLPVRADWLHPGHQDLEHVVRIQVHDFATRGQLQLQFDLKSAVFGEAATSSVPEHFVKLLDAFLDDPDRKIASVGILSASEAATFKRRNSTAVPLPGATTLSELLALWKNDPDLEVLDCESETWTAAEFEEKSRAIASALSNAGVRAGDRVAILRRRSGVTLACFVAAWRVGAAFVPIDPIWPPRRVSSLLREAGATAAIVDPDSPWIDEGLSCSTIVAEEATTPEDWTEVAPAPDDVAYVLFTSGSTGRPKGVVISHEALLNYVTWARDRYTPNARLAFPLFSPLTFDLTMTSAFVPLLSGGKVVVYPETGDHMDLALLDVVREDRVDIVKLTPSHLRLLDSANERATRVSQLIVGGEELDAATVRRIRRVFGAATLVHNEYGPTEATVGCTVHSFRADSSLQGSAPIGTPIANMRAHVVSDSLDRVPEGVVGELCLAGAGLATGYLGREELTSERFVPCPWDPSERMYRTGDLARWNAEGLLEYLGRTDSQVKVRGARIEPAEIETRLREHSGVEDCIVLARNGKPPEAPARHCVRCGLPSTFPEATFDGDELCRTCRTFETYRERTREYFRPLSELVDLMSFGEAHDYDCLALLSGGKDSTYVLCRLVDLGFRVHAFTLDNGYLSQQAKDNIRRVVTHLGVPHEFATTPHMNEIFVDSLERHSNVCQGCFKAIYTLAIRFARERRIPFIVTGLSRGQFFETRLTEELFTGPRVDPRTIDETVLQARKAYHRVDDAVARLLETADLSEDEVFEEVRFVDFFRYCDVGLDEMMKTLEERVPWVRPQDTGRSTNCLINDVGIWVHQAERGFHNYALPYSWDVRLGHKDRAAALEELHDEIDVERVGRILDEIGYGRDSVRSIEETRLVAYYTGPERFDHEELTRHVADALPSFFVPAEFVFVKEIPTTENGKVDRDALAVLRGDQTVRSIEFVTPRDDLETRLASLWADALRLPRVGVRDDFFQLGGDSILAIQIVARAHEAGFAFTPGDLFETLTVEKLASRVRTVSSASIEPERSVGEVGLSPAQAWLLDGVTSSPHHWNHVVRVGLSEGPSTSDVTSALEALIERHDALRLRFDREGSQWGAICEEDPGTLEVEVFDDHVDAKRAIDRPFDLARTPLIRAAIVATAEETREVVFVAHHLVVDPVSWTVLCDDFEELLRARRAGATPRPPRSASSLSRWGRALTDAGAAAEAEVDYWNEQLAEPVGSWLSPQAQRPRSSGCTFKEVFDRETSERLLREVPRKTRLHVQDVLLASLVEAISIPERGRRQARVFVEGHGRDALAPDVDVTQAVGWFANLYPVNVSLPREASRVENLERSRDRLRAVPRHGVGFLWLRHHSPDREMRERWANSEESATLFNYLGNTATPVGTRNLRWLEPIQLSRGTDGRSRFPLEVAAYVHDERLVVQWSASPGGPFDEEVAGFTTRFVEIVRGNVKAALAEPSTERTAADFPLADLSGDRMDKLRSALKKLDSKSEGSDLGER